MGYLTPADVPISENWFDHRARGSLEPGTDYGTAYGTPLRAPASGKVIGADWSTCGEAGRRLTMLLDDGRMVDWIHLSEIWVNVGDRFDRGALIAKSGASRRCLEWGVGPHVHVTLRADQWRPFADTLNFEDYVDGAGDAGGTEDARLFLESLGYDTGGPGWGPVCDACAKDFQASVGLVADGIWGPNTTAVQRTIEGGRNATDVPTDRVQRALADAGFNPGPIDNDWGNKTSRALFQWQGAKGLQQDAIFGPASAAQLLPSTPVESDWNLTDRPTADIQRVVGATPDGDHGPDTDAKIRAWQTAKGIDADGIWGRTSDGLAFPPEGMKAFGVDFSEARPTPATLKARGVAFVPRYLWNPLYQDGRINKGISAAEHQGYMDAGIAVPLIYEEDGTELKGGYAAGVKAAQEAERHRLREGIPARPVYFNVDYDAPEADHPAILAALDGAATVIGLQRVGLYGPYGIIRAAFNAGKIAFGMQCFAWSQGQWDPRAQLRQWSNGQWGNSVDFQWAMAAEYGQTPVQVVPPVDPKPDPEPEPPTDLSGIMKLLQQILDLLKRWFGGAK
ncbi:MULTISPECIES: peptidoglycan-binding protein [unclassified Microbacterium]|uniref:peptidoglycan-binding protein n=1 Tax=unclassified Microbacterium TaxID=2609290 RepID=UPI00364D81A6